MIYLFVLAIGLLSIVVYLVFALGEVPGMKAERIGELEPLPEDLNHWRIDEESELGRAATARGERRQLRHVYDEARGKLAEQERFVDAKSSDVLRLGAERTVKRRRIRA